MYLLLDHLCNKYFISNYYKSLFIISTSEVVVTHTHLFCLCDGLVAPVY